MKPVFTDFITKSGENTALGSAEGRVWLQEKACIGKPLFITERTFPFS
jgi:hypothetical protein